MKGRGIMAAAQKKPMGTAKTTAAKSSSSTVAKSSTAGKKTQTAGAGKKQTTKKASSSKSSAARSSASKASAYTAAAKTGSKKTAAKGYSSSAKRKKTGSKNQVQADYTIVKDIAVIAVFVFGVILQLSCFFTGGGLMQLLHTYNFGWFGAMAYLMPVLLFLLPCFIISNWHNRGLFQKVVAVVLLFLSIETILSIVYETTTFFTIGGGLVGHTIFKAIYGAFGIIGSYVVMAALLMISLVLFFGHSVMAGLHQNSKKAYRAVSSHHKIQQDRRKIQAQERRLRREQEENEQLEMQRIRLEALQKQRQEILEKRDLNRSFVNIQLKESKKQEEQNRQLLKQQNARARKELRTNTELEEEDRSMKEIVLGKDATNTETVMMQKKTASQDTEASHTQKAETAEEKNDAKTDTQQKPSMFIEGEEISSDFSSFFENSGDSLSRPIKLDVSGDEKNGSSELDDGWVRESDEVSTDESKSDAAWDSEQENSSDAFGHLDRLILEKINASGISSAFATNADTSKDLSEDLSGASVAGDESVDYRMLMRDTKNMGKHDQDESMYTKTVRTATGKVITVELDGLPGENKRPKDSAAIKEKLDQYDERVVPIAYEESKEYIFPSTDLLTPGSTSGKGREELARSMQETADKLKRTLQDFGVGVTITNISRGPSVTRYELQPEQGVKVSKIVNLADDIKLNLAAEDIRIEAPIPGKAAIGIEVPNKEKQTVAFRDLLESDEFTKAKSKTVFAAGKDIAGKTVVADIEKMPHLLIAGQTGSGKSVCINTIIMSILYKARPSEVKLIMIDPKVVELSVYNGIPHLLIPVVTDPKKAAAALNWAVNEMEERYKKFAQHKARNIIGYNAQIDQIEDVPGKDRPEKIPQIIVIVDELADLMMTAGTDVEDAIQKLAQKARAAGIHLIIATQRPSVNVITGIIKANIPSRIAFSVASGIDSRTILDETGAEKLLGKGDMLFHPYYISKPVRVQGAFVSDEEVTEVVNFLTQQKNVKGGDINTNIDLQANMPGNKLPGDEQDELFETAGRFIIEQEKASIGNLQRHLRIGFNRAARIMDQLYAAGVVSKDEGTKPRKVLMKAEEFEEYLAGR
jgi:DNA segregation ATPase FtsK/SpoIIIE, S-DNA-T family